MPNPPTTWGNKRARTGPSGRTPPALPTSSSSGGARDWANLGGDRPTGLIAELVLANDVADYVRFRAVCRAWRQCSPDPRDAHGVGGLDGRFLPRQWIMLDKAHDASRRHRFLNVSTGECIRTDLPELADHTLLALTHEGLLLLLHEPTLAVRLLNPLTRRLSELPPVTGLLTGQELRDWRSGSPLHDMLRVAGAGLADASTVAICFRWPTALAVARPGDERWTVVDDRFMDSTLACAGRFYCAIRSSIMVLDTSAQPPRLRPVVTERGMPFRFFRTSHSLHLLDNGGELMMVRRTPGQEGDTRSAKRYRRKCMVFRVDIDAGTLAPTKDLRGRAVFLRLHRAISVSAGVISSVTADTLYLGYDCAEKTAERNPIDGYNVADGSSEPSYHDDSCDETTLVHPCSLVDSLSHCIQGNGEHLA